MAAAMAMRLWCFVVHPGVVYDYPGSEYGTLAAHWAQSGTLSYDGKSPSAIRLPLYPLLLAAVYTVTDHAPSPWPARPVHLLLAALVAALTYHAARRLVGPDWALGAALLAGMNPELAQLDWGMAVESLFTPEFIFVSLTALRALEAPERTGRWLACGAAVGVSLLTRSTLLFWPPILGALLAWHRPVPGALRRAALLCAAAYLCLTPWLARNWAQFHRVIPFEDGMGWHMLWQGSTSVEGIAPDEYLPEPLRTYFFTKDPRIGPASKELALRNIRAYPLRYAGYCLRRIPVLWFRGAWAERGLGYDDAFHAYLARGQWHKAAAKALFKLIELSVIGAALVGMAAAWPQAAGRILALQLLYMNIHIFTMGLPRYMAPVFPLTALFAVKGASWLWQRRRPAVA